MNRAKRYGALLLAIAMVLGMSISASADTVGEVPPKDNEDNSIIIHKYSTDLPVSQFVKVNTGQEIDGKEYAGSKYNPTIIDDGTNRKTFTEAANDNNITALGNVKYTITKGVVTEYKVDGSLVFVADGITGSGTDTPWDGPDTTNNTYKWAAAGTSSWSGRTNDDGLLPFESLPFGTYQIEEEVPITHSGTRPNPFYVEVPTALVLDNGTNWLTDVHVYPKNIRENKPAKTINQNKSDGTKITYDITIKNLKQNIDIDADFIIRDLLDERLMMKNGTGTDDSLQKQVSVYYVEDDGNNPSQKKEYLDYGDDYSLLYTKKGDNDHPDGHNYDAITIILTEDGKKKLRDDIVRPGGTPVDGNTPKLVVELTTYTKPFTNLDQGDITNDFEFKEGNYEYKTKDDTDTPGPKQVVGGINILKYETGNKGKVLDGATFYLYTSNPVDNPGAERQYNPDYDKHVTTNDDPYLFAATKDGKLLIGNLPYDAEAGFSIYWLVEVDAPEEYNLLTAPVEVRVDADSMSDPQRILEIANNNGFTLPPTGGNGTLIFTVAGLSLITIAGVAFILYRRRRNRETDPT